MKKFKRKVGFALLAIGATALSGCFGKKNQSTESVEFWSSFGAAYTGKLDELCAKVTEKTGVKIEHDSLGGYKEIRRQMTAAIPIRDHPNLAIGYPDHFVSYLGQNALVPLDDKLSSSDKEDYYPNYLKENKFYDNAGTSAQERLYGVPFNKSTELLGYNGVFVDYCASVQESKGYSGLENVPATWQEWAVKGPQYKAIFDELVTGHKVIYGEQNDEGKASGFVEAPASGKKELLNFRDIGSTADTLLMAYDATDNAFITLIKQWGAQYTELPSDQATNPVLDRVGKALFTSSTNLPKVVECLKFFNGLYQAGVFGVPGHLGSSYASNAFEQCKVMFMICSSGGLSYNTTNWAHRFRVAPVPYYDKDGIVRKAVIAQGANICVTDQGSTDKAVEVLKAFTTGEVQAEWCLETGYFPGSKSAYNTTAYQNFLNGTSYGNPTAVAYREGAKVNSDVYNASGSAWDCFVDPAFDGSAILRESLEGILKSACDLKGADASNDSKYEAIVNALKTVPDLQRCETLEFVS